MTPWWSPQWINEWGMTLISAAFWPLLVMGARATQSPAAPGKLSWITPGRATRCLVVGVVLGVVLLVLAGAAQSSGQPAHVYSRLFLYGSLFVIVHGALLVSALVAHRKSLARGGVQ